MIQCNAWGQKQAVTLSTMGFFGEKSIGYLYDWNHLHKTEISVGSFNNGATTYYQVNAYYQYGGWFVEFEKFDLNFSSAGLFLNYALNQERYFLISPSKYPTPRYYEQTALRGGLQWSSSIYLPQYNIEFIYFLRFLDNGIVA